VGRPWSAQRYGDEVKESGEVKETLIKLRNGGQEACGGVEVMGEGEDLIKMASVASFTSIPP
jgi:hypothetical protein